jgi:hypothetical protein
MSFEDITENKETIVASTSQENPLLTEEVIKIDEDSFTRANVEALGNNIKLAERDEDNDLDLFCYVKCSSSDSNIVKQCRGVIFNGNNIVMKAFPYTVELSQFDRDIIESSFGSNFKDCRFYDSHEGALIRMFNFNDKWFTCTHRKLNAFKSKWASKESFGSSFKKALEAEVECNEKLKNAVADGDENLLERFQMTLDKTKQYMFLVRNTSENRIVCIPPTRPMLYHVGTFIKGELNLDEDINIPKPNELKLESIDDLCKYVDDVDNKNFQGVIVFAPNNCQYKILNKEYQKFYRVRGNEASIKFRYLQVRMNREYREMLYYLYPDMREVFDSYENILYDKACAIHNSYIQRYIKGSYVTLPKSEYEVMNKCHSWHVENRETNKVDRNKVIDVLNQQNPTILNRLIKEIIHQSKKPPEEAADVNEVVEKLRKRSESNASAFGLSPVIIKKNDSYVPALSLPKSNFVKTNPKPRFLNTKNA